MMYRYTYPSALGNLVLAADDTALCGAWFEGQKYFDGQLLQGARPRADLPVFADCRAWLNRYFAGVSPGPVPPVRLSGSPFRQRVWDLLRHIPYGRLQTYGSLAAALAREAGGRLPAAQAVGGAVGHNPVSVFVPCHRVVGARGQLTGYAGGIDVKRRLLALEGIAFTADGRAVI